jgi:hypothetical protein
VTDDAWVLAGRPPVNERASKPGEGLSLENVLRLYRAALDEKEDVERMANIIIAQRDATIAASYSRAEVEAAVNYAIDEAPLLKKGYRKTSVARIIQDAIEAPRAAAK